MSNNRNRKKVIKLEIKAIRRILNAWDPIAGSPEDEYDCLVHRIISDLHSGIIKPSDIARIIKSELKDHFGISKTDAEIFKVAENISLYWSERNQ